MVHEQKHKNNNIVKQPRGVLSVHPSIHYTHLSMQGHGRLEPILADTGWEAAYPLDRSPVHHMWSLKWSPIVKEPPWPADSPSVLLLSITSSKSSNVLLAKTFKSFYFGAVSRVKTATTNWQSEFWQSVCWFHHKNKELFGFIALLPSSQRSQWSSEEIFILWAKKLL